LQDVSRANAALVDAVNGTLGEDVPVTCKRGCANCCHLPPAISLADALRVAVECREVVERLLPVLKAESAHYAAVFALDRAAAVDALITAPRPCAFLTADNDCAVYEARPLRCRSMLVETDDPKLCLPQPTSAPVGQRHELRSTTVTTVHDYDEALAAVTNTSTLPLPIAVLTARRKLLALARDA
jgi:Fe-S-cluster containining protein